MDLSEFQVYRKNLKEALLRYGERIGRLLEALFDDLNDDAFIHERKKRNLKEENPIYYDIKKSIIVAHNANLGRAIGYFSYTIKDESNEVYFINNPENYWAMALREGWEITEEKRVIDALVRLKTMKILD